jgi:hypothetical protein
MFRVKEGVLQHLRRASDLVTLQEGIKEFKHLESLRGKPWQNVAKIPLASLYKTTGTGAKSKSFGATAGQWGKDFCFQFLATRRLRVKMRTWTPQRRLAWMW